MTLQKGYIYESRIEIGGVRGEPSGKCINISEGVLERKRESGQVKVGVYWERVPVQGDLETPLSLAREQGRL